jgi:DNA-binding CsgD family transcriptional regulator
MARPRSHAKLLAMEDGLAKLTAREREVLRLLAFGHTNREVAGALRLSIRTAEVHRASIQHKLELKARSELVRFALGHGLMDDGDMVSPLTDHARR